LLKNKQNNPSTIQPFNLSTTPKLLVILVCLFIGQAVLSADLTLKGGVDFEWVSITQIQRDAQIDEFRQQVFSGENILKYNKSDFKTEYKDFLNDPDYKENFWTVRNEGKTTQNAELCAFHWHDVLYMYAVKYRNNTGKVYYYDTKGRLQYVDVMSGDYPDFPYTSKQYRISGKLVSAIYFASHDLQYLYEPDGKFKGVWFKENMYDRRGLKTLTRTNW
jgi:hypothetical protein